METISLEEAVALIDAKAAKGVAKGGGHAVVSGRRCTLVRPVQSKRGACG